MLHFVYARRMLTRACTPMVCPIHASWLGLDSRLQEASSADPAAEAGPATNAQPLSKFEKLRKRKNQGIQGLGLFLAVGFSAAYRRAHAGCHALAGCLGAHDYRMIIAC